VAIETTTTTLPTYEQTALLRSSVSNILGQRRTQAEEEAREAGATTKAGGYAAEATSYQAAQSIALQNAGLVETVGEIKSYQAQRAVSKTVGEQQAAVASAGFGSSGTSLDLLRSSLQEGVLTDQLIKTQTSLTKGAYLQEAAAAESEAKGALFASEAATQLAASLTKSAATAKTNAANETAALTQYLKDNPGLAESEMGRLTLSTLGLPTGAPAGGTAGGGAPALPKDAHGFKGPYHIGGATVTEIPAGMEVYAGQSPFITKGSLVYKSSRTSFGLYGGHS